MARKQHSDEDVLKLLLAIELKLTAADDVASACRSVGISDVTYYNWRRRFDGMGRSKLSEMKSLEKENARLKTIVAELVLDKLILKKKPETPIAQGLTTEQLRQAVIYTRQKLATSERRTCRVVGLTRSSLQYRPTPRDDDALRLAIIRLEKQYGLYGYGKVTELLHVEGWKVNHKKVEQLWREERLQLPQRHKKRRRLCHKDSSIIRMRPTHPNHVSAIDFVHDKLSNGRAYNMLTVLDEYTRQAPTVTVRTKMSADDVLEALYPLLLRLGTPEYI